MNQSIANVGISKKSEKFNCKLFLFTLLIIFLTDSLLFGANGSLFFLHGKRYLLIILAIFMFFSHMVKNNNKLPVCLVLMSWSILVSSVLSGRFLTAFSYYSFIATLWFSYVFSKMYSLEDFSSCYCKIMRVIAIASIIGWLFYETISSISWLPIITNTSGVPFRFCLFTNVPVLGGGGYRNWGPFWEPGAYQIYLVVALYFTLFIEKHKFRFFDSILFIITALSTLSGAAFIPILLLIAAYAFERKHIRSFVMVLVLLIVLLCLVNSGAFNEIFDKMNPEEENASMLYRWVGIEGSWKGFLHNPLFGSPPEINEAIKTELSSMYIGTKYSANTNTFLNFFAYYGIFIGGFMIIRAFLLFRDSVKSKIAIFLCFFAFILSTSNENMTLSIFIVTLLFLKPNNIGNENVVRRSKGYDYCRN